MKKEPLVRAYLDIETTGFCARSSELTVVGICLEREKEAKCFQLIGENATGQKVKEILKNAGEVFTYNGSRFDLPFIREKTGFDIEGACVHHDLMYDCWKHKLTGGLKAVERKLGIERKIKDVDGWMAVVLWKKFRRGDGSALKKLLLYNREDVMNLRILRLRLQERCGLRGQS